MDFTSIIAKTVQNHARQSRWIFRRGRSRAIKERWLRLERPLAAADPDRPGKTCLLDIRQILFDGPQGRRFHALVTLLEQQEFQLWVQPHLQFLQTGAKGYKWSALGRCLSCDDPDAPPRFDLCLSDSTRNDRRGTRTLLLTHQSHRRLRTDEIPLPFSPHPELIDGRFLDSLADLRSRPRRWTCFFGGSLAPNAYKAVSFFRYLQTVHRSRLLEIALGYFDDRVRRPLRQDDLVELLDRSIDGFLFADSEAYRIPMDKWLESMATAKFFIAAPGSRYPMSHNCVESLAVGTIPILEYTELFQPPLRDGVNCLAFRGEDGFRRVLKDADQMSPGEVASLRSGAMEYYDKHLSGESLTRKLDDASYSRLHCFPYLTRPS